MEFLFLFLTTFIPLLITVAFFTLVERKVIALIQRRAGPNVVSFFGLLQPIADALKAILKELVFPKKVGFFLFLLGPLFVFFFSVVLWVIIPLNFNAILFDYSLSFLFFFVLSSLSFYGILLASWSSNSKYAVLAAFRSIAQVISYEIYLTLTILPIIMLTSSWNFVDIVFDQRVNFSGNSFFTFNAFVFPQLSIIYFISVLAETNRIPFDLGEAEAEIVAGYNVEYSGLIFAFFFLGEYSNMILNAVIFIIVFFGGWSFISLVLKTLFICFLYVFVRAILPRYRYDQVMDLGWKTYLPLTISTFYFYFSVISCGLAPYVSITIPIDVLFITS